MFQRILPRLRPDKVWKNRRNFVEKQGKWID